MGFSYGYGGIPVANGRDRLLEDLLRAERDLRNYNECLKQPIGSSAWEFAAHTSKKQYENAVRSAKKALEEYDLLHFN